MAEYKPDTEDLSWVYETPQVEVKGYEEIPTPPAGAARWAESAEDPSRRGELKPSSPEYWPTTEWGRAKELGRRLGSAIAFAKDKAKQNIAYGADYCAGNNGDTLNEVVPANTQDWWSYDTKRQDYKSDADMPYSAYTSPAVDPSKEYANFTDTDVYRNQNWGDAEKVGTAGRAIGNLINKLGGNFETSGKDDEMAFRKGLATLQGVQGYMADTLPEQIEALVGELGLRGAMATLGPAFVRAKKVKGQMDAAEKDLLDAMRTEKDMAKIKDLEGRANAYGDVFYGKLDDFEKQAEWRKLGETFLKENHPEVLEQIKKGYPTDLADSIIKDIGASRANGRPWGIRTYRDYGYPTRGHRIADVRLNRNNADKLKQIVEQGKGKDADRVFRYLMDENNVDDIPMDAFKNTIRGRAFMEGENLPMPDEIINQARKTAEARLGLPIKGDAAERALNTVIADEMKRLGKDYGQAYYDLPDGSLDEIIDEISGKAATAAQRVFNNGTPKFFAPDEARRIVKSLGNDL